MTKTTSYTAVIMLLQIQNIIKKMLNNRKYKIVKTIQKSQKVGIGSKTYQSYKSRSDVQGNVTKLPSTDFTIYEFLSESEEDVEEEAVSFDCYTNFAEFLEDIDREEESIFASIVFTNISAGLPQEDDYEIVDVNNSLRSTL